MRIMLPPPPSCPDCGSDPVYHTQQYVLLLLNRVAFPAFLSATKLYNAFFGTTRGSMNLVRLYIFLERIGLGEFKDEWDDQTLLLSQVLWQEARTRGISMREFRLLGLPRNTFIATFPDGRRIDFEGMPYPSHRKQAAWWMDIKPILTKKLRRFGVPVAKGSAVYTQRGARRLYPTLKTPIVVKPYEGSASRHTTMHIQDEEALMQAFNVAKQVAPFVMIEEELLGSVYRPTIIGGKLVATLRRDRPHVVGDGVHTLIELVEEANTHPSRQGPYFSHLKFTPDTHQELERQGIKPTDIIALGQRVELHQKINWSLGGTTAYVTDDVHIDNKLLFEEIARILHAPVVGIDFIIEDISKSWREQEKCGVIECNSMPYFDNHHLPFTGQPRNVASAVWELVED
jgi:D-alanine-D-alanine ligase-like ATP-grasp enzyme